MESVRLATGMLIAALHVAGLVILTHTPRPMAFLNEILGRPNGSSFCYRDVNTTVPDIGRKPFGEMVSYV